MELLTGLKTVKIVLGKPLRSELLFRLASVWAHLGRSDMVFTILEEALRWRERESDPDLFESETDPVQPALLDPTCNIRLPEVWEDIPLTDLDAR
jgi:hypothetical protein